MTIKRKNIRPGGLLEVEADPTDSVDTGGFSVAISSAGTAKTAQFSDTSVMQANSGLRIGITQLKVTNAGANAIPRTRTIIRGSFGTVTANGEKIVVDYGSIATNNIFGTGVSGTTGFNVNLEVSTDDVSYTVVDNITGITGTMNFDGGLQTYRYVRFFINAQDGISAVTNIFETIPTTNVTINIRSSATQDTANGTIILSNKVINDSTTITFDDDLLLTGITQFVTLEILSFSVGDADISLSGITSIKEV